MARGECQWGRGMGRRKNSHGEPEIIMRLPWKNRKVSTIAMRNWAIQFTQSQNACVPTVCEYDRACFHGIRESEP